MFLGHYAAAFAAKRFAPRPSLGVLVGAALFIDLLWPVLLLLGIERVEIDPGNTAFTPLDFTDYPVSHSLAATLAWGLLAGGLYYGVSRCLYSSVWVGALVPSHWLLDAIVHRPDLPLAPGVDLFIGLGLWNSVPTTLAIELLLFFAAVWSYLIGTRSVNRRGTYPFGAYVALLLVIYAAAAFGPPPPNTDALAWAALAAWLFVFWAAWFDRHRTRN